MGDSAGPHLEIRTVNIKHKSIFDEKIETLSLYINQAEGSQDSEAEEQAAMLNILSNREDLAKNVQVSPPKPCLERQ